MCQFCCCFYFFLFLIFWKRPLSTPLSTEKKKSKQAKRRRAYPFVTGLFFGLHVDRMSPLHQHPTSSHPASDSRLCVFVLILSKHLNPPSLHPTSPPHRPEVCFIYTKTNTCNVRTCACVCVCAICYLDVFAQIRELFCDAILCAVCHSECRLSKLALKCMCVCVCVCGLWLEGRKKRKQNKITD